MINEPSLPEDVGRARPAGAEARALDAVAQVAARDGYAMLTVERVLARAGVSRASFYQYFTNIDDCFRSAYRVHAAELLADVLNAVRASDSPELAVLKVLAALATDRPDVARLLMREGLAAAPAGLAERETLIASLERAILEARRGRPPAVDLPTAIMIGGVFRFISMRMSGPGSLDTLADELRQWTEAFASRAGGYSWSLRFAPALPSVARRSPVAGVARRTDATHRGRIVRATMACIAAKGFRDLTVTDIVSAAGVSRRSFYNAFSSRTDAFIAAYEHAFQQTLAACTPAFFTSGTWPERVWEGAQAFTRFLSRDPLCAYIGFVECYAMGPGFVTRVHDTQLAFTLFLEEGYRQRPEAQSISRTCSALIAATIFEAGFQASRRSASLYLRPLQPLAVFIALAPFVGADEAGEFVLAKLLEGHDEGTTAA